MTFIKNLSRHPSFGIMLAAFGALMITPDTLFMRLSELSGWAMLAWRGTEMGLLLLVLWLVLRRHALMADLAHLKSWPALLAIACHAVGNMFFSLAVAETAISIVLIALACSPLFAALFSRLLLGEKTLAATWIVIVITFIGVAIAVSGDGLALDEGAQGSGNMLAGALFAICAAALIGLSFVCYRRAPDMNVVLVTGSGALGAGLIGLVMAPSASLLAGHVGFISINGLFILPVSFIALTYATRYTQAANVSLLMIIETILGPIWVWMALGERPTNEMFIGGLIVVTAIFCYTLHLSKHSAPAASLKASE